MDKLRITLAIIFSLCVNIIIKLIIAYIEGVIKRIFTIMSDKVNNILSLFYPIFSIAFIFLLAKIYPAIIFEKYQYCLNLIIYAGVILAIYHWFFKPILNKIAEAIKNYQTKNEGDNK